MHAERGFSLLEVLVCGALLVAAAVVAAGALPALLHSARAGIVRDGAREVAWNALERARAASAYVPPEAAADPAGRAAATATHAWALAPASAYVGALRIRGAWCGSGAGGLDVPLDVRTAYDAAGERFSAVVAYPRDPCDPGSAREAVAVAATLAPPAYAPQTVLGAPVADPAQQ